MTSQYIDPPHSSQRQRQPLKKRSVSFPCDPAVRQRIRARMVARKVSEWRRMSQERGHKEEVSCSN